MQALSKLQLNDELSSLSDSIIDDQYIASNDIQKFLSNHGFQSHFTALSLNIRSINNSINFSKLESLISSLKINLALYH